MSRGHWVERLHTNIQDNGLAKLLERRGLIRNISEVEILEGTDCPSILGKIDNLLKISTQKGYKSYI